MIFKQLPGFAPEFQDRLDTSFLMDETAAMQRLLNIVKPLTSQIANAEVEAAILVTAVRSRKSEQSHMQMLMHEFSLGSEEGIVLMCLAEALLRVPDNYTADQLIKGKLSAAHWEKHLGEGRSLFINASSWGLMLTGRLLKPAVESSKNYVHTLEQLVMRLGEPVVRTVLRRMMRLLGEQFVMGEDIGLALANSQCDDARRYRFSFDMLGEAAITQKDAEKYYQAYSNAIAEIGKHARAGDVDAANSISVKLSALYPRYELAHCVPAVEALSEKLCALAEQAAALNIGLTVDAEEADRLEMSLEIIDSVLSKASLHDWAGLGLAVQAYQRRAIDVIDIVADMCGRHQRKISVRLVKGAYWDTEIKRAQERGLASFPVFTRKENTDVSYLACAIRLFQHNEMIFPQFATHNAFTIAAIKSLAGDKFRYEFQRLHGMGDQLYDQVLADSGLNCRVYAPVGRHEDLLPYLVRRLLENGANSSFVNQIEDASIAVDKVVANPLSRVEENKHLYNPRIIRPKDLFGEQRDNSSGMNLASLSALRKLQSTYRKMDVSSHIQPIINGEKTRSDEGYSLHSPINNEAIAQVEVASADLLQQALKSAHEAFERWSLSDVELRAQCLLRLADLLEENRYRLMFMCTREAGRTVADTLSEVREAIDFCRYYASQALEKMCEPQSLPGPTGESNQLYLQGRGVFVCISPWNFPVAIFVGQIAAALVSGNAVIAKPASQTPGVAALCVELMHKAGIPVDVLHFVPVSGKRLDEIVLSDSRVAGVAFTGSTDAAFAINSTLVSRKGGIATFIGETGGQNVMLADSSALPEQLVNDCIYSAFNSAGQRCSALRVLYVQEDIAERVIELLKGAMALLQVGDPYQLSSDVGPVIDAAARESLRKHIATMEQSGKVLYRTPCDESQAGYYLAPTLVEIDSIAELEREIFGPVLHLVRYRASQREQVVKDINATGFGLTFGIHSRIDQNIVYLSERVRAGNIYVNRNMVGAVVGVQPFGGMGLSGTGPKAGGPHYLNRFTTERTVTINTAAVGGNAQLLVEGD